MPESFNDIFQYIPDLIFYIVGDIPIIALLVGTMFLLIGIFIVFTIVVRFIFCRRVPGKVLGAIRRVKTDEDKIGEKTVIDTVIYYTPVYEYMRKDGSIGVSKGMQGGNLTFTYNTGQEVSLMVLENSRFDEVTDANSKFGAKGMIVAAVFLLIGAAIILPAGGVLSTLKVSLTTVFIASAILVTKLVFEHKEKASKKHKLANKSGIRSEYSISPEDIIPIEELAKTKIEDDKILEAEREEIERLREEQA